MCKQSIDDIFIESKMNGLKFIIVEGHEDPYIYEKIAEKFTDIYILPIELVDGYSGGCIPIINASNHLEATYGSDPKLAKTILFIADKDVRDFRGEIINNSTIIFLSEYSIESHFVNRDSIKRAIEFATKSPRSIITDQVVDLIYSEIENSTEHLFLCSIDALNAALSHSYTADVTYDTPYGGLSQNTNIIASISTKRAQLLADAASKGLSNSLNSLRKFCKGKWLLENFCINLEKSISNLTNKCSSQIIPPCGYCATNNPTKCYRKIERGITYQSIKSHVTKIYPDELDYVENRIRGMYN